MAASVGPGLAYVKVRFLRSPRHDRHRPDDGGCLPDHQAVREEGRRLGRPVRPALRPGDRRDERARRRRRHREGPGMVRPRERQHHPRLRSPQDPTRGLADVQGEVLVCQRPRTAETIASLGSLSHAATHANDLIDPSGRPPCLTPPVNARCHEYHIPRTGLSGCAWSRLARIPQRQRAPRALENLRLECVDLAVARLPRSIKSHEEAAAVRRQRILHARLGSIAGVRCVGALGPPTGDLQHVELGRPLACGATTSSHCQHDGR